jgi:hypothetical protein
MYIKIILLMILLHIIDDFVLQPISLSKLKQKSFWEPYLKESKLYKNDYKVALIIHGLSWSIMVHLPFILLSVNEYWILWSVVTNAIFHAWIDNEKANKLSINLLTDQLIHLCQIITIFVFAINKL